MDNCLDLYDDKEIFRAPYLEFAIGIPIFILLQLSLLLHSIYNEILYRDNKVYQTVSIKSRILYIILQLIGLWWTINDLFYLVIDPHTHLLRGNIGCDITAYSPKIIPSPYYLIYLYQILLRLESSFKGSYLALSKMATYILFSSTLIPVAVGPIIFFILNRETPCLVPWNPVDFKSDDLSFCWLTPRDPVALLVYTLVIAWIAIMNIIIGVIFAVKLNKLLSTNKDNDHIKFQFKSLIIKNGILTLTGSISTILCHAIWYWSLIVIFLYLDLLVNCLVIGLMFKTNEKWYKRSCRCFIILCFMKCDKGKRKLEDTQILGYVNDEINLSVILNLSMTKTSQNGKDDDVLSSIGDIVSEVDRNEYRMNDVVSVNVSDCDEEGIISYGCSSMAGSTITPRMGLAEHNRTVTIVEMNKIQN